MKNIFYLDTNLVYSYLAQIDGGIIIQKQLQENEGEGITLTEETLKAITRGIDIGGDTGNIVSELILGGSKITGKYNQQNVSHLKDGEVINRTNSASEIISMVFHDYVLNKLEEYFVKQGMIKEKDYGVGDFVLLKGYGNFIDFDYYLKFEERAGSRVGLAINLYDLEQKGHISLDEPIDKDEIDKELEPLIGRANYAAEYLSKHFQDPLISLSGNVVILNSESFRRDYHQFIIRYGANPTRPITVLGKITRKMSLFDDKIGLKCKDYNIMDFLKTSNILTDIYLYNQGIIHEHGFYIDPIACYFYQET